MSGEASLPLRTRSSTAGLPSSAALIEAFTGRLSGAGGVHPVLAAAAELAEQHRAQWAAEDRCRDELDEDGVVAEMKRAIDAMNARRTRLVDQTDAWVVTNQAPSGSGALHTETLGHLLDRLAVAWVRFRTLADRLGVVADRADSRRALVQLAELCEAYDDLVCDLREGRRRLPDWRSLKRYGAAR